MTGRYAGEVAARLDRLPLTSGLWRLIVLISLGGAFEFYDLLMTAYVAPGLVASGLFTAHPAGFFAPQGIGFFVFCTFAGMWLGSVGFGFVADRMGRRSIFTVSLVWYCLATAVMAFQHSAVGIDLWRFIAAIGVGLEQVTIDTLLPELVPPPKRGRAFAINQGIEFAASAAGRAAGLAAGAAASLWVRGLALGGPDWRFWCIGGLVVSSCRTGKPALGLALHGRDEAAEKILRKLEACAERDIGHALPPPDAAVEPSGDAGRFGELFRPPYLKRTLVMSVFNAMQTIAFYGFGSWVPSLLIAKGIAVTTGLNIRFHHRAGQSRWPASGFRHAADRIERKWQIVAAGVDHRRRHFAVLHCKRMKRFGDPVRCAGDPGQQLALFSPFAWLSGAEQFPTRVRARAVGFVYSWSRVSAPLWQAF